MHSWKIGSTYMSDTEGVYLSSSNDSRMSMCVSSEAPMMWTTEAWPTAEVIVREPKPLERVCAWCGAMFFGSKYYPGNCICCGGPRGE